MAEAIATAEREQASRVEGMRVAVGGGAHAGTAEALEMALRVRLVGTIAEGATLIVETLGPGDAVSLVSLDLA